MYTFSTILDNFVLHNFLFNENSLCCDKPLKLLLLFLLLDWCKLPLFCNTKRGQFLSLFFLLQILLHIKLTDTELNTF